MKMTIAVMLLGFPLLAWAEEAEQANRPVKLPSAEEIIANHIEATGGEAARRKVKTRKVSGHLSMPQIGVEGTLVEYAKPPAYTYSEADVDGLGKTREGTDGKLAWVIDQLRGPRLLEGESAVFRLRAARFYSELDWKLDYKSARTLGEAVVKLQPCYKVELVPHSGDTIINYYDQRSHLMLRSDMVIPTAGGKIPVESYVEAYKDFDGVKVPTKTIMKMMGQEQILEIKKYEANVEIPDKTFDVPEEIQAILDKRKNEAGEDAKTSAPATKG